MNIDNTNMYYAKVRAFPFSGDYYLRAKLTGSKGGASCTVKAIFDDAPPNPLPVVVVTV